MLRNVIPRRSVARRKIRCFTLSSRSIAASASTIVRLLQIRMNVFNPVRGTLRIWPGVAHGPWNVAKPGVPVLRRKVKDEPMIAEKNMICVARDNQLPSLREQTRGHRDATDVATTST